MIPVMKPLLPKADKIAPYLRKIDDSRWYSNNGPLNRQYEARLEKQFSCKAITASSATSALTALILSYNLPHGSLIACPSWTFSATAAAIVAAGHCPYFFDVDSMSWMMSEVNIDCVAMLLVVVPFGEYISLEPWEEVSRKFGIPLVVDGAAAFDYFSAHGVKCEAPVVISTHGTKTFCTGEGGIILCRDEERLNRVRALLNHGIDAQRNVTTPGVNGKLSEYHAAIGLAELDGWDSKWVKWKQVQEWYGNYSPLITSTQLVMVPDAVEVKAILHDKGIETRVAWYGCHHHPAYRHYRREPLPMTELLMRKYLALPKYIGMTEEDVMYIQESLRQCGYQ